MVGGTHPHSITSSIFLESFSCPSTMNKGLSMLKSESGSVMSHSLQSRGLYVACQAPLSMGFSRQEHWSGQPFPSPGDLPNPGMEPRSPAMQGYLSLSEPSGKPKNTGVNSLFLLQGIFLTQELSQGLLHYRQDSLPAKLQGSPNIYLINFLLQFLLIT